MHLILPLFSNLNTMNHYLTFDTERLILRPTNEEDAAFVFELLNTPKWLQYIGDRQVNSVEDAQHYIRHRMLPQLEKRGFSNYTIIRKSDGKKMGSCGLYERANRDHVDIGFAFLPEFEGQGYAYEAAHTLLKAGFERFDLDTINAYTTQDNFSSQKLLERLGLIKIGNTTLPDDDELLLLYSVNKPH